MEIFKGITVTIATFCLCWAQLENSRNAQLLAYDFQNIGVGPYYFSFASSDGIRRSEQAEVQNAGTENQFLIVRGEYSYQGPDGINYVVTYTADENGFHPQGQHITVPSYVTLNKASQNLEGSVGAILTTPAYLPTTPKIPATTFRPTFIINSQFESTTPRPFLIDELNQNFDNLQLITTTNSPFNDYVPASTRNTARIIKTKGFKSKQAKAEEINSL